MWKGVARHLRLFEHHLNLAWHAWRMSQPVCGRPSIFLQIHIISDVRLLRS